MPFTQSVRTELCDEAGLRCAAPHCRAPTGRPDSQSLTMRNGGDAAHICGEKPGSPRYNWLQTDDERGNAHNGIWLCPSCHRMIDRFPNVYSVELLFDWKARAQSDQRSEFLQPRTPRGTYDTEAELRKARIFLDSHRETVGALTWLLAATVRNPFQGPNPTAEVTNDISSLARKVGLRRGVHYWDNTSPDWCFAPELHYKQQELMRLVDIINRLPAFHLFPQNRYIGLGKVNAPDQDPRYADDQALAIAAYSEFFRWFEASLSRISIA